MEDLNSQLSSEKGRVSSLEAEVETLQDIRDSLQEQIKLLEERLTTEETRCKQVNVSNFQHHTNNVTNVVITKKIIKASNFV